MNQDKARDFFSAYYENVLDAGLKQSLEQRLREDAILEADYIAFSETIEALDSLKHEEIEIPSFLSDRIATRLEQVPARQKFGLPLWTNWMRGFAFAGLAVAAIAFALPFFGGDRNLSTGGPSGSGTLDQLVFKADGSNVVLNYVPSSPQTLIVSSPTSGKEIQRFNLDGQRLQSPIENSLDNPAIFKVQVLPGNTSSMIVVPGASTLKTKTGDGSIQDLAVSLAGHYHVPVVIEAADVTHHVSWNFASPSPITAASQAVSGEGFSVDQRSDGVIKILDR